MTSSAAQGPALGEAIVRGRGVVLAYGGRTAVAASDLEIPRGRVTAVIGPNGSGKSTLLNAIAGLIEPRSGRLEVAIPGPRHRGIAYVLQSTSVNESMPVTVREVVAMGRYARLGAFRPFAGADREVCRSVMARLEVEHLADRHLGELSGGLRQRVFVAQGLVQESEILLLDEAVTGLDLVSKETILGVVADEAARGVSVVMTTHDLEEARRADHVLLLAGRVVAEGPPEEVVGPEALSQAYGVRLVPLEGGQIVLDDPHHRGAAGRHVHFDRTGHAEHGPEEQGRA